MLSICYSKLTKIWGVQSNDIISYPNYIHVSVSSSTNTALTGVTVIIPFFFLMNYIYKGQCWCWLNNDKDTDSFKRWLHARRFLFLKLDFSIHMNYLIGSESARQTLVLLTVYDTSWYPAAAKQVESIVGRCLKRAARTLPVSWRFPDYWYSVLKCFSRR